MLSATHCFRWICTTVTNRTSAPVFSIAFASCLALGALCGAAVSPQHLTCEFTTAAVFIDTPSPRLGWQVQSEEKGQGQSGYQILAATSPGLLSPEKVDLWDSQYQATSNTLQIPYGDDHTLEIVLFYDSRVVPRDGLKDYRRLHNIPQS